MEVVSYRAQEDEATSISNHQSLFGLQDQISETEVQDSDTIHCQNDSFTSVTHLEIEVGF